MNICIPVSHDQGLQSEVSAHFGSAPIFMMVATDSLACRPVINTNQVHDHGMCQPLAALAHEKMDAIVVKGIGMGALGKLRAAHVRVFKTGHSTVQATLDALRAGELQEFGQEMACSHHH